MHLNENTNHEQLYFTMRNLIYVSQKPWRDNWKKLDEIGSIRKCRWCGEKDYVNNLNKISDNRYLCNRCHMEYRDVIEGKTVIDNPKMCKICKKQLPRNNRYFANNQQTLDGLSVYCHDCDCERWRKLKK